jgi:TRAP-type C4-dicarboxylate transport system substrate-binding protein
VTTLKLAIHMEPGKPVWQAYERWAKKIEQKSKGKIKIEMGTSGFVGIEEWDMLRSNHWDLGRIFTLEMKPFPMHIVPALPYVMPEGKQNLSILNALYDKFLYQEWREVKVLWLGLMSAYHLHTAKKAVRTLEDLRGMRLHASGLAAELAKTWGATPISLFSHDGTARLDMRSIFYNSLKNGDIDGAFSSFELTRDFELGNVTRYHTYLNVIRDVNATVMNLLVWNGLPGDIRKLFEETNAWAQREFDLAQKDESTQARDLLIQKGHEVIELPKEEFSRWKNAAGSVVDENMEKLDAQGIPAMAIASEIQRLAARK